MMNTDFLPEQMALSLDTNTYYNHRYNFNGGPLKLLEQFKEHKGVIIQTEIVYYEGLKYLTNDVRENIQSIKTGARNLFRHNKLSEQERSEIIQRFGINEDPAITAKTTLDEFYDRTGTTVIDTASLLSTSTLLELYFRVQPPFEHKTEKKHEFPDAIALLCLNEWAEQNDKFVLVVTKDSGWKNFIEGKERLRAVDNIADALELFQPIIMVHQLKSLIEERKILSPSEEFYPEIISAIIDHTNEQIPAIEASSFLYYEYEDVQVEYLNQEFETDSENNLEFKIIHVDRDNATIQLNAKVHAEVSADFDFSVYDSFDKDHTIIGGFSSTTLVTYKVDVLVHFSLYEFGEDREDTEIILEEVEVSGTLRRANFGTIGPDYDGDDLDDD